jgi:type II secretory pathway pseudopilin PulG
MELLIVMLIIAVLAALALTALQGAAEDARADRTRSTIAKLDQLLMERYNAYRTRALPLKIPADVYSDPAYPQSSRTAAWFRVAAIRDLMRMELPDRKSDVIDGPAEIDPRPPASATDLNAYYLTAAAMQRTYQRKVMVATGGVPANWTENSQGAECLYLIVSTMHDGDKNALDFLMPGETGDFDGDGMREILDGWGRPIEFLRWAPGYTTENGMLTMQTSSPGLVPDPFDPIRLDPAAFSLRPLIFSGGRDKSLDIVTDNYPVPPQLFHHYCPPSTNENWPRPFAPLAIGVLIGTPQDTDSDGPEWADNITNHYQPTNGP